MNTYVFVNRVYPPEAGATGELLRDLAEALVALGDRAVVVTSRGGASASSRREVVNGVQVIRVGSAPFTRASHWRRALSYAGLYPQFAWQVWRQGRVDAVVSMTDPPLQLAFVTLASFRAKRSVHWAQDVYPELAEELRVIRPGVLLARVLRALSTWALAKQDKVVVLGRCMRERLVSRGVDERKIETLPNWTPVSAPSENEASAVRDRLGWGGQFVALYSGNLGLAHDFETLIGAAKLLDGSGIRIVFAGEGPRLGEVRGLAGRLKCVSFLPPQPKKDLAAFLAAADVHLVTMRSGLEGLVVPSKAYGVIASGPPLVYVGPDTSEIGLLVRETASGTVVANGDAAGLASVLLEYSKGDKDTVIRRQPAVEVRPAVPLSRWREILQKQSS